MGSFTFAFAFTFPKVISALIVQYLPDRELLHWICEEKLDVDSICINHNAIHLVEQILRDPVKKNSVNWMFLSVNPKACHIFGPEHQCRGFVRNPELIKKNERKLMASPSGELLKNWRKIVGDPDGIIGIENIIQRTCGDYKSFWYDVSENPFAICLIEKALLHPEIKPHLELIDRNPAAIRIIKAKVSDLKKKSVVNWRHVVQNPAAFELIKFKLDECDCNFDRSYEVELLRLIALNPSPDVLNLVRDRLDSVAGGDADSIWRGLSSNPAIFREVDKSAIFDCLNSIQM